MKKIFTSKRAIITVLSILLVLSIMLSTTYALFMKVNTLDNTESYTSGILEITVEEGTALTLNNSLPMTDEEGSALTPYTFKVTNTGNIAYTFDLKLLSTTTSNQINPAYIKVKLDNNNPVTLSSVSNGLIASDLTLNPNDSVTMSVRIWLSIDTPNTEIGKSFSAKIVTDGVGSEYVAPLDTSGANAPDLLEGLIPIKYNGSTWVKADETNGDETYQWYDYDSQMWANAVLVSDSSRATYESASMGTTINESDVLAYYVWVPRYKYKLFNATKTARTDSYNARTTGIDIVFETGTGSTGTVSCTVGTDGNESCTGASNGAYYTHPAFTFGSTELTGIWVGKFELTGSTTTPTVKPNVSSLRSINVSTISTTIAKISGSSNTYGVNSSEADSHMMKNMEWGAVAYLSNSKYGRCPNGSCTEIGINNNSSYTTGCGAAPGSSSSSSCNAYTTETGMLASTTGNIYGIYDMSGGAFEYVMGNMVSNDGSTMMSGISTSFNSGYNGIVYASGSYTQYSSGIAYPDSKYYDRYQFSESEVAGTRGLLGDATSEVVVSGYTGWNNDSAYFVRSAGPWFQRGGSYGNGSGAGAFHFIYDSGGAGIYGSGRAVLVRD